MANLWTFGDDEYLVGKVNRFYGFISWSEVAE